MKIIKILLDDGTSREIKYLKPLSFFENKYKDISKWYQKKLYENQFNDFENDIIDFLNENNVEEYVKDRLNLVDENDIEENDISDFIDSEILNEFNNRGLNQGSNIITSNFLYRFENIVKAENSILLDKLLTELENKLNI